MRIALRKLGERPSSFVRGLTITRIARAAGYNRTYFSDRLTEFGIDPDGLRNWRTGSRCPSSTGPDAAPAKIPHNPTPDRGTMRPMRSAGCHGC